MIDLGCPKLIRRVLPIVSSADRPRKLVLEPWADEFVLEPNQQLVVVFVGPEPGELSFDWGPDWLAVYGWPGSEGFVFQGNRRLGEFSSDVNQIVRRQMQLASGVRRIDRNLDDAGLAELGEMTEYKLTQNSFGSVGARDTAAFWASEIGNALLETFESSESTASLIWRLCTEIFHIGGYTLPQADPTRLLPFLRTRSETKKPWHSTLKRLAVSICPTAESQESQKSRTKPPSRRRGQRH